MLVVEHIEQAFGGVRALRDVSLAVDAGKIVALIGPNGAGKTTLFSVISGFQRPAGGRVLFEGQPITGLPAHRIARLGLVRTFQITRPFAALSVRENIAVGAACRLASRRAAMRRADAIAEAIGLTPQLGQPAGGLTVVDRKRLEVARALASMPRMLLLDEVFAGLNPTELTEMLPVVEDLRVRGIAILLTEHVLQAVRRLADRVVVLSNGGVIARGSVDEVFDQPGVQSAYLGKPRTPDTERHHGNA